ncbi:MAG TPA: hypothetical protein VGQ05_18130 [Streptosporangiaceae bacterium]|nr:hypothetical protein [Streptosporangiaceae bacterium]
MPSRTSARNGPTPSRAGARPGPSTAATARAAGRAALPGRSERASRVARR